MVDIIFKNVGAGDSIIINIEEEESKLGIVDCKKHQNRNPVLEYVKNANLQKIDFIVLSHPHQDHYSGFNELLDYIDKKKIEVSLFLFSTTLHHAILESIVSVSERRLLSKVYLKVKELTEKGIIKHRNITSHGHVIQLTDSYHLKILSPSLEEVDDYTKTLFSDKLNIKYSSNPNIVSTVLSIESEDKYVLLTSDAENKTLRRVGLSHLSKKFPKKINLGQIPHHGSINNHKKDFWRTKKYEKDTPLAISVGKNSDGHPSEKVVNDLASIGYKILSTWANGIHHEKQDPRDSILSCHSSNVTTPNDLEGKDLEFNSII